MSLRVAQRIKKSIRNGEPFYVGDSLFQTWFVVEKCVEGPESGNLFCHVVGVLKEKAYDLARTYRQTPVLVLTKSLRSRSGFLVSSVKQFCGPLSYVALCPVDFEHKIFGE